MPAASRLLTDGWTIEGRRDKKVALPTPGDPRKRMSMCGVGREATEGVLVHIQATLDGKAS